MENISKLACLLSQSMWNLVCHRSMSRQN